MYIFAQDRRKLNPELNGEIWHIAQNFAKEKMWKNMFMMSLNADKLLVTDHPDLWNDLLLNRETNIGMIFYVFPYDTYTIGRWKYTPNSRVKAATPYLCI